MSDDDETPITRAEFDRVKAELEEVKKLYAEKQQQRANVQVGGSIVPPPAKLIGIYRVREPHTVPISLSLPALFEQQGTARLWTYYVDFQFPRSYRAILHAPMSDFPSLAAFENECKEIQEEIFSQACSC